jgi:hypothetical protein
LCLTAFINTCDFLLREEMEVRSPLALQLIAEVILSV